MEANIYGIDGKMKGKAKLPSVFSESIRPELIKRAVLSEESKLLQPKGNYQLAGMQTSARYIGRKEAYASLKNKGQAKLPREFFGGGTPGRVRQVPHSPGGRRAHPPKPWKKLAEKINRKEWAKALKCAFAASANEKIVKKMHAVEDSVPIVLDDGFEKISKTKELYAILEKIIAKDLERAKSTKRRKTGVEKKRKSIIKKYSKSALIISMQNMKSAKNIPGIDNVLLNKIKVKDLAPGTRPGRLLLITEGALKQLNNFDEVFKA